MSYSSTWLICWSDNTILNHIPFFSGTESVFFIFPLNQWIYNWETIWEFKMMWKLVYMKERKEKKKMWNWVSCIFYFLLIWIKYSNFKMNRTSYSWTVYFRVHIVLQKQSYGFFVQNIKNKLHCFGRKIFKLTFLIWYFTSQ